jgi:hypothetical protein
MAAKKRARVRWFVRVLHAARPDGSLFGVVEYWNDAKRERRWRWSSYTPLTDGATDVGFAPTKRAAMAALRRAVRR